MQVLHYNWFSFHLALLYPPIQDSLKARRKVDRKKKKKAAGWKSSADLEGHVNITELNDLLDFVGAEDNENSLSFSQQQKKKKFRSRQKLKSSSKSDGGMNGKCSTPCSSASDSELDNKHYNGNIVTINNMADMNGTSYKPEDCDMKSAQDPVSSTSSSSTIAISADITQPSTDNDQDEQEVDGEFMEVHRKRKVTPKIQAAKVKPVYRKPFKKPMNKPIATPPSVSKPKVTASVDVAMDLSLNSFPVLESQYFENRNGGDGKSSVHTESSRTSVFTESATDDDRDSIASQPSASGKASWAKIAAKPGGTVNCSISSSASGSNVSSTSSYLPMNTNNEQSTTIPSTTHNDYTTVDLETKIYDDTHRKSKDFSSAQNIVNDSKMTRSVTAGIEFGTVTSSNDLSADRHVHNILSQSFSEGQTRFKLCLKNSPKSNKISPNQPMASTNPGNAKIKNRGVEFLDDRCTQAHTNLNIVFGFSTNNQLAQQINGSSDDSGSLSNPPMTDADNPINITKDTGLPRKDVLPVILTAQNNNLLSSYTYSGNFRLVDSVSMLRKGIVIFQ